MGLAYVKTLHVCSSLLFFFPFQNSIILLVFQTHLRKNCRLPLPTLGPTTDRPTGLPGSTQGCNCPTYTAVSTRHNRDNTQARTGQVDKTHWNRRKHATDTNPIPQVHPACNRQEPQNLSGRPMTPHAEPAGMPPDFHTTLTTSTAGTTTHGAKPRRSTESFTTGHVGRANWLAGLLLKKQKTKKSPNTQCCKQPFSSTSDNQYCKS